MCNVLLGGIDEDGPAIYWIDYLGNFVKCNRGAHGYLYNFK